MMQRTGRLAIQEPSRYMQRLCYHFSRKIEVRYDEHEGLAAFPWGTCVMRAEPEAIVFECIGGSEEELQRLQFVIDEHVRLFARHTPLAVEWDPQGAPASA